MTSAQQRFDEIYISSSEIFKRLQVTRSTVSQAVKRQLLPEPIKVNKNLVSLWERASIEPLLSGWAATLDAKRK
jgi:predicted DNA-binding transcriptional regulator AlpA